MKEHYLIVANGDVEFSSVQELQMLSENRRVIALDGAANLFYKLNLLPSVAIGDFDSLSVEAEKFLRAGGVPLLSSRCQETTDLEKALGHVARNAASAVVIHGLGGRQDHGMGNVFFLKKYAARVPDLSLLTRHCRLIYREDTSEIFHVPSGSPCGFFGLPAATVTSEGLRYEMRDYRLKLGHSESIANESMGDNFRLHVRGQCLISLAAPY
ncbi:MAG: thiamine diphosphokinase [Puniceicoccales bacterium]|jgi:thiamine pyrophosphokinase|nr:thiamine diphosphokinase [Puniceicoccales bacterium]